MTLAHEKRPNRPQTPGYGESKHELTFTVGRGFKWKVCLDLINLYTKYKEDFGNETKNEIISIHVGRFINDSDIDSIANTKEDFMQGTSALVYNKNPDLDQCK